MKTKMISLLAAVVLMVSGPADADIVTLDLFTLGCPQEFDWPVDNWDSDFDLGVEFSEISAVYMDWSGEITASLVQYTDVYGTPIGDPRPTDIAITVYFGSNPDSRRESIWGGDATHPDPEPFDEITEIELPYVTTTWSDLLDGTGHIYMWRELYILIGFDYYADLGLINLTESTLIVEGTIIPEPASMLLLFCGTLGMRRYSRRRLR